MAVSTAMFAPAEPSAPTTICLYIASSHRWSAPRSDDRILPDRQRACERGTVGGGDVALAFLFGWTIPETGEGNAVRGLEVQNPPGRHVVRAGVCDAPLVEPSSPSRQFLTGANSEGEMVKSHDRGIEAVVPRWAVLNETHDGLAAREAEDNGSNFRKAFAENSLHAHPV